MEQLVSSRHEETVLYFAMAPCDFKGIRREREGGRLSKGQGILPFR